MIDEALVFIRDNLNQHIHLKFFSAVDNVEEQHVVFLEGDSLDTIVFESEAVSVLLVNIEEEKTLRSANLYSKKTASGLSVVTQPEIKLNLYILFVPKYKQYDASLKYLSLIINYFQANRSFSAQTSPALSDNIGKLNIELVTQAGHELSEMWGTLKTSYHPSLLYKLNLLVFMDQNTESKPVTKGVNLEIGNDS
jgi:hypothetical protein